MKAFEEWIKEYHKDKDEIFWIPYPSALKIGWIAALEQVLARIHPYDSDSLNIQAVCGFIKGELEQ